MLVLTRRVGETLYLGDDACVTVYDRLRYHVLIAVLTSADGEVRQHDSVIRPAELPHGKRFFLLSLIDRDVFQIGSCRVGVRFSPTFLTSPSPRKRQLKLAVDAPPDLAVWREELHRQQSQALGRPHPMMPMWEWLRRANAAVACGLAA